MPKMSVIPQWAVDSQSGVHGGGDWHMVKSGRDVLERLNNADHSLLLREAAQPSHCVIWAVYCFHILSSVLVK